ncbi:hypothetical protein FGE12_26620 [Aggregicoccus sp. 17bor-14]|uniref:hypothetical protein n=1 Tax=Myxococcaceae TaxID=31 RepID=UPI00129C57BB|nr:MULTISPECIES: hypothetical protein [Myxococcaceae]MBF5046015.1 hypothetical protein [Simulacricoccus sp. 17bor-14]MRI91746.1 hypothetical protein [Aggregicoccus sp. 17bor-14]
MTGSLFRSYVAGLDAMGLRAPVRAAVSARVQALMDTPPTHREWLGGNELAEIFRAVVGQRGIEGIRQLGYEATRLSTLQHLRPMIQATAALHGNTPDVLFSHLDALCKPFFRGLRFEYAAEGPRTGTLTMRSTYPMGVVQFAAWEGALRHIFEELKVKSGVLEPARVAPDGHSGTMRVRW